MINVLRCSGLLSHNLSEPGWFTHYDKLNHSPNAEMVLCSIEQLEFERSTIELLLSNLPNATRSVLRC